jgi:chemotaxis signal transduction protein
VYLRFHAGGHALAVPVERTAEVIRRGGIVALPEMRAGILGVVIRRGVAVPVVSLPVLAGDPDSGGRATEMVIVEAGETRLALEAEAAAAVSGERDTGAGEAPPAGWTFLTGRVRTPDEEAWLLDPAALAAALGAGPGPEEEP